MVKSFRSFKRKSNSRLKKSTRRFKSTKRRIRRKTKKTRKIKRYRGGTTSIEKLLSNVPKFPALKLPQGVSNEISQKISIKLKEHGEYSTNELEKNAEGIESLS